MSRSFRYAPRYRPPYSCNLPEGLRFEIVEAPQIGQWRSDLPVSSRLYGVIETTDPIPAETIAHFDLEDLP